MDVHVRIVGAIHVVFGALGLLLGVALFGVAAIIPFAFGHDDDTVVLIGICGLIGTVVVVFSAPGFLGGIGLLRFRPWARILILIKSGFDLLSFPIGTALAVYAFWSLLHPDTTPLFQGVPRPYRTAGGFRHAGEF